MSISLLLQDNDYSDVYDISEHDLKIVYRPKNLSEQVKLGYNVFTF